MKKKTIIFALLVLTIVSAAVYANSGMVKAVISDIIVTLNGKELALQDVNGKEIKPVIIEGTTYLPVRAISNALGIGVNWDAETKTVILNNKSDAGKPNNGIYGKGDTWETPFWKLTVNSVKSTSLRNNSKPATQVVIVNYTYENVRYVSSSTDKLLITVDNIVDEFSNTGENYYIFDSSLSSIKSVQPGVKTTGDRVFALVTPSKTVKLYFDEYDPNYEKKYTAVFELPVE